ncbi:unnamed protein product [Caenorhabditis angaria]|uniref:Nucleotide-diphospho-sugar transferase domain-containing protein n=1 Tax=Caenorhabditis angaria TaxID=860376 RepID=A0A9P1INC7_9PELO|nr:unnamed protein product [Caenorhabditis angaria]
MNFFFIISPFLLIPYSILQNYESETEISNNFIESNKSFKDKLIRDSIIQILTKFSCITTFFVYLTVSNYLHGNINSIPYNFVFNVLLICATIPWTILFLRKNHAYSKYFPFILLIVLILFIINIYFETNVTSSKEVKSSKNILQKIAIVIVVEKKTKREAYQIATDTVECYAKIQNYEFIFLNESNHKDDCNQTHHFFRRHCVVAKILPNYDAILFIDADVGVVNPNRRIEEYMDDSKDIIFYDRFYNWEVALGSYIVRNTNYAVDSLMSFANYNFKLPKSFHGTDNGILHLFLAQLLFPQSKIEIENCQKIYNKSRNYKDLFTFEACIRTILGTSTDFGKVRIMHKGTAWIRDNWLSNSKWSRENDFMLHGWKTKQLRKTPDKIGTVEGSRGKWFNPLIGNIDLTKCRPNNSTWNYDLKLIGNVSEILENHRKIETKISMNFVKSLSRMIEVIEGVKKNTTG